MTLSTKKVGERRSKVAELREKHDKLFELEGLGANAKFVPKMAYIPQAGAERIIAFFPSEVQGGVDVYTEFVSRSNVPEDPERTLWKWVFNPNYDTAYEKSEPHPATGHQRYLVPVTELINVALQHMPQPGDIGEKQTQLHLIDPVAEAENADDAPIAQLTIRDKAAIDWKQPVSKKKWLNDLIIEQVNKDSPMIPGPG
jgi:hypothetical protein